ncbi:mannose-1-phosphate guanylyltransferase [Candidatus Dojkabacteria bacterium]|uniref:Mannose-1-phosphate guanylyltransferase n=1 Tax=Candidatus Dojkabacteria bacterium TaxID=2099670 RepID=A0A955LAU3_9BACT|nr:mannose-1-phosphate guanylyltransferase [Candidatus Dojkabacteria bacterium]
MKLIIFAGGTGKRFWPVSRKNSPKQFSSLIFGKPLIRIRIEVLLKKYKAEDIFISTGRIYEQEVRKLLPELPPKNFILEPEMRDTGPATALAVSYVHKLFPNEKVCIQWSDQIMKDNNTFLKALEIGDKMIRDETKIIFLSVPVRFPSVHRGYIQYQGKAKNINKNIKQITFNQFKEKPDLETAKKYFSSKQYGWNPGYWILDPEYFLSIYKEKYPEIYNTVSKIIENNLKGPSLLKFSKLERISADYAFAENVEAKYAKILECNMGWSDVGEWISLKEALQKDDKSNVVSGNVVDMGSTDSIIYNLEDKKLVSTINLDGFVVVNTKDVIAIFRKEDNSLLKEYLKNVEESGRDEYL